MALLHLFILFGLLLITSNYLLNLKLFRFPSTTPIPSTPPLLSILIPARDEEQRIAPCLDSISESEYPSLEILVLDDHSQDGTAKLIERHARGDSRIRMLRGQDLPEGWTGKAWACHQLALAARGELLLFLDADTRLTPQTLPRAVGVALEHQPDLLSLWPQQETKTWSEMLVIPFVHLFILLYLPHWIPGRQSQLGAANGQFMLFRRDAYRKIGGHESVRGHMVEDIALARRIRRAGLGVLNLDGSHRAPSDPLVRCRMYNCFREVWEGFTKNLYPSFDGNLPAFCLFQSLQILILLAPFILFLGGQQSPLVWTEIAIIYSLRLSVAHRFDQSLIGALLHPFGQLLVLAIAGNSFLQTFRRRLPWKGRHYAHT